MMRYSRMNRALALALAAVTIASLQPLRAYAEPEDGVTDDVVVLELELDQDTEEADLPTSGTFGELRWRVTDKELTITGSGDMLVVDSYPWAGYSTSVQTVTIGNGITSIGDGAFRDFTKLNSVNLGGSMDIIGTSAFEGCSSLTAIDIPYTVDRVGSRAFADCGRLSSVMLAEGVIELGSQAFADDGRLWTVFVPKSVITLGDDCIPAGVTVSSYPETMAEVYAVITGNDFVASSATYTIQFDGNGKDGGKDVKKMKNRSFGQTCILNANRYTRKGYTFTGWNTKKDGSGLSYSDKQTVRALAKAEGQTVTLYAQWQINSYKIMYNGNGADSGKMETIELQYKDKYDLPGSEYKRAGYEFAGWNTAKDGSSRAIKDKATVQKLTTEGYVTLYARWEPISYTIRYDDNGATLGGMQSEACKYGKTYVLAGNKYWSLGHKFAGWNTKADGSGTAYTDRAEVTNVTAEKGKTVVLYAQWE